MSSPSIRNHSYSTSLSDDQCTNTRHSGTYNFPFFPYIDQKNPRTRHIRFLTILIKFLFTSSTLLFLLFTNEMESAGILVFSTLVLLSLALSGANGTHHGDGTCYDTGLGACGQYSRNRQLVAAVSVGVYGSHPNPNNAPICGRQACVQRLDGSRRVTVTIVDKCMGCKHGGIDLSLGAASRLKVAGDCVSFGRIPVKWRLGAC